MMGSVARVVQGYRDLAATALLAALTIVLLGVASASAEVSSFEVREYHKDLGVSVERAGQTLEAQSSGIEANIVGELEDRLANDYAGVWFDNAAGEFVVPVLPDASRPAVSSEMANADLRGDFRTTMVESSWADLEAAQERLNKSLRGLVGVNFATSLDPRTNAVVVNADKAMNDAEIAKLQDVLSAEAVRVEVRLKNTDRLLPEKIGCHGESRNCSRPLRGGVALHPNGTTSCCPAPFCSAGFKALGNSDGNRYLLTAGHCAEAVKKWTGFETDTFSSKYIGPVAQWLNGGGDWAKINVTGRPYWDEAPWPTLVAYWGTDQERAITGESSSFLGQQVCHAGANTGASCGIVTAVNVYEESINLNHATEVEDVCVDEGDSGGPVFVGQTALGLVSAGFLKEPPCHRHMLYVEIIEAADALGVSVATRATQTTAEAVPLNGTPGWVTVKGKVISPTGAPVSNKKVEVKLFKWENNSWALKATLPADVNNNSYEIANWNGVGPGTWLAKAIFPAQAPFGGSQSNETNEGWFTIKDGYQLVNGYSGKCLDVENSGTTNGVNLQQWTCGNPQTALNQVFTMVPKGDSSYQIVARNSNRCADVINSSQSNGGGVQQWDCGGSPANQIWKGVDGGVYSWVNFKAKHSGKCLEIGGPTTNNGAKAQQWSCLGASQTNQLWGFKSVDAGPIPTKTTHEITQVLNGEYGWVSLGGNVSAGAYSINNVNVNIQFFKKEGGNWNHVQTINRTVQNGHFSLDNHPVGVGEWKVRSEFSQQGSLGASQTGEAQFEIKKGYQLINGYSGKCLDVDTWGMNNGVNLQQWDCGDPATHKNQVFTLEPRGESYYHLVAKHSGRCLDVINGSYGNGAWVQQWDCYGDEFFHQIWKGVDGGVYSWVNFKAKHSGKCLEIGGPSYTNGAKAQQWDCLGPSQTNQLWGFKSVTW